MMKKVLLASTAVAMAAAAVPASAATTVFTDRASFDLAAGATTLVDFNSFASEVDFRTTALDVGPFSLAGSGTNQVDRNFIDLQPPQFSVFDVDGTTFANLLTNNNSTVTITFDSAIFAFGADFGALNDDIARTEIVAAGDTLAPSITAGNQVRFFGFTSDTAFTTVTFTGGPGDGFGVDNVSFGGLAGGIPEPTTWAMLIFGFGAIGGAMRKKRKANVSVSYA